MDKIIEIKDAGLRFNLNGYGRIITPLRGIRFTDRQIFNLINMHCGPKFVYAVSPTDNENIVLMTNENYMKTEEELFFKNKEDPTEIVDPEVVVATESTENVEPVKVSEDDYTIEAVQENQTEETEVTEDKTDLVEEPSKKQNNYYNKNKHYNKKR